MKIRVILDTGPLVAYINKRDKYHNWAVDQWSRILPPFFTCESVMSEACFLLKNFQPGINVVFEMISRNIITFPFRLNHHLSAIRELMDKYKNIPISLADACLVRMAELEKDSSILTTDKDFLVYRKPGSKRIPTIMPDQ